MCLSTMVLKSSIASLLQYTSISKTFNNAPRNAEIAKIFRGLKRSATPKYELINAPFTNPIGTEAES